MHIRNITHSQAAGFFFRDTKAKYAGYLTARAIHINTSTIKLLYTVPDVYCTCKVLKHHGPCSLRHYAMETFKRIHYAKLLILRHPHARYDIFWFVSSHRKTIIISTTQYLIQTFSTKKITSTMCCNNKVSQVLFFKWKEKVRPPPTGRHNMGLVFITTIGCLLVAGMSSTVVSATGNIGRLEDYDRRNLVTGLCAQ